MNKHAHTNAGQFIIAYFNNHHVDSQRALSYAFNQLEHQELHHCFDGQTLLDFVISANADVSKRRFAIETLLRRAIHDSDKSHLFQFLLTKPNHSSRTPFYEALEHHGFHDIAKELSEWSVFGLRLHYLTKADYAAIHLTKNKKNHYSLLRCAYSAQGPDAFKIALLELTFGVSNRIIPQYAFIDILQQPYRPHVQLVDFAFLSSCPEIIEAIWHYASKAVLQPNASGLNVLDCLALKNQLIPLQVSLDMLDKLIEAEHVPCTTYNEILLAVKQRTSEFPGRRILNLSLMHEYLPSIILAHAQKANHNGWLSDSNYATFLLDHPRAHLGFNNAHEAILHHDSAMVYDYLTACLSAVVENKMSLESFVSTLLQPNRHGYNVFHQAINNQSLSQVLLFMSLARTLLPTEIYQRLLMREPDRNPPELRRSDNKSFSLFVNQLILAERQAITIQTTTDRANRFFAPLSFVTPLSTITPKAQKVMRLIALVHALKNGEWTPNQSPLP